MIRAAVLVILILTVPVVGIAAPAANEASVLVDELESAVSVSDQVLKKGDSPALRNHTKRMHELHSKFLQSYTADHRCISAAANALQLWHRRLSQRLHPSRTAAGSIEDSRLKYLKELQLCRQAPQKPQQ